eukprot:TRINITY_DN78484_c0_g1_i1.p1 TRINITY_DN78484_c0_g1~~TRINITY_DN78484_c0_g1_i1.p1  ORF type:complete len:245 (-),score=12.62 TRINITY_DN78484_c0_g1_i1:484-1158(-)
MEASLVEGDGDTCCISNRALCDGNFSLSWLLPTCVSMWFCFIYGPPQIRYDISTEQPLGPCFALHLLGSILLVVCCAYNIFHTPSHGPFHRKLHVVVGITAVSASLVGACFGLLTTWYERYAVTNQAQRIGLTILGILQAYHTIAGWRAIRQSRVEDQTVEEQKQLVLTHARSMVTVFICCFGASMLRVVAKFGANPLLGVVIMLAATNIVGIWLTKEMTRKME